MASEARSLTKNDRRVLRRVEHNSALSDGFAPHGPAEWTAIRRLLARGLVGGVGVGECQSCSEPHDVPIYVLTAAGEEVRGGA